MKKSKLFLTLAAGFLAATLGLAALADDTSQLTLTGTMVCGKCKLHVTKKCQNVLQVESNGTNVNYFLTRNQVSKDFHSNICGNDGEKATVTGTVKEKHGKEMLTATKIVADGDSQ
ncbi:MAG: DUF6370 family protein [Limisphaerales bacterium]